MNHKFSSQKNTWIPTLEISSQWFQSIRSVNQQILEGENSFGLQGLIGPNDPTWKIALNILGSYRGHLLDQDETDLIALQSYYKAHIDPEGAWLTPLKHVENVMKGYSLLYLAEIQKKENYQKALAHLADFVLNRYPRTTDGSLPYEPGSQMILVDTLAMICPFLARYARQMDCPAALEVSVNQLKQFIINNLDPDSHLPYHGYYPGGAKRLGLHAWGRGVGWYMAGLVDTLIEMSPDHADFLYLLQAYQNAARTLQAYQRQDGDWNWAILHAGERQDCSTTALVGYSLLRGLEPGWIDYTYRYTIESALLALQNHTLPNGLLNGSLGECLGMGKYPQNYGPSPWLQGAGTAFAALYYYTYPLQP